ncbi:MAG: endonuclease MutS2 [Acidobacteria bacterium]|nr:endonuclease MutS2 [Acidobacteriota bacterium]
MNPASLDRLEFSELRALVRGRTTCPLGRAAVEALAPSTDRAWIETELARVAEAVEFLRQGNELGFASLDDPTALLAKLNVREAVLAPDELLQLAGLLNGVSQARTGIGAPRFRQLLPRLRELAAELEDHSALERDLRRKILPGGEVDSYASAELAEIRNQIQRTEQKLHRALRRVLERAAEQAALQDEFVTLRGGRLVVPIRSDARTRPDGVVHAESGTGHTLFLEPLETIALNNELVALREQEATEIRRILAELTRRLAARRTALTRAAQIIGHLDAIFARARFAREFNCTIPRFDSDGTLALRGVRHPLLVEALKGRNGQVVPLSAELTPAQHVLVISGPNAGGKTVAVKTIGLAALAAQAAIPVAAEEARLPVFDRILADIGDAQSIVENLSTFSAHILNLQQMVAEVQPAAGETDARSLVLLDELGAATSPEEGAALGIALLEHFRRAGALVVATTHHERLKAYAASTPGAMNAAVEFDEVNLRPTYRLRVGIPGASSGIEMAARLGLPREIVAEARSKLATEATENAQLVRSLHRTQQELEQLQAEVRTELERLRAEREQLRQEWLKAQRARLAELERELQGLMAQYRNELRAVVDGVRQPAARARVEKSGIKQLSRVQGELKEAFDAAVVGHLGETARPAPPEPRVDPEAIVPGAWVRVRGIQQRGQVRQRLDARTVELQMGSLRMRAALDDIVAVETPKPKAKITVKAQKVKESKGRRVDELDVRGLRVEEARERVDKFLDQAVLAGLSEVRIIHGTGTGRLKQALAEFLAQHPHVESTRAAEPDRGGAGVTVVSLRGTR